MGTLVKYTLALLTLIFHSCVPEAAAVQTWTLDDFEDGDLKAASGLSWTVIADDLMGGATVAHLDARGPGAAGSKHALRLSGTLGGEARSFAGAWISLDRTGRTVDLSAFEGVRLRVRGAGPLDVGFRSGVVNFMTRVDAGPTWRLVDVPFARLAPVGKVPEGAKWNAASVQVFGVTTPQAPAAGDRTSGEIAFEIDDVAFYGAGSEPLAPVASGPAGGLAVVPFTQLSAIPSSGWKELATDPEGDTRMRGLPDVTRLEAISSAAGMLWVRLTLREPPHDRWIGLNLALDVDGDPANGFAWWGANTAFKFDRVVTVWCFHVADGCQGYIGMADAAQAAAGTFVAGGGDRLRVAIDREHRAYVLGVPRDLIRATAQDIRLVAAVGSALLFGDDVPGQGAATIR